MKHIKIYFPIALLLVWLIGTSFLTSFVNLPMRILLVVGGFWGVLYVFYKYLKKYIISFRVTKGFKIMVTGVSIYLACVQVALYYKWYMAFFAIILTVTILFIIFMRKRMYML